MEHRLILFVGGDNSEMVFSRMVRTLKRFSGIKFNYDPHWDFDSASQRVRENRLADLILVVDPLSCKGRMTDFFWHLNVYMVRRHNGRLPPVAILASPESNLGHLDFSGIIPRILYGPFSKRHLREIALLDAA